MAVIIYSESNWLPPTAGCSLRQHLGVCLQRHGAASRNILSERRHMLPRVYYLRTDKVPVCTADGEGRLWVNFLKFLIYEPAAPTFLYSSKECTIPIAESSLLRSSSSHFSSSCVMVAWNALDWPL